ncbi:MAG: hypothetical protein RBG13Loki_3246 [Promethearchaeota archaeon CR_4]|nr:MAG: hypothetical protein RBG13Loki_3246 [Candidatus Lokiarchaeota archaeon CR_4]
MGINREEWENIVEDTHDSHPPILVYFTPSRHFLNPFKVILETLQSEFANDLYFVVATSNNILHLIDAGADKSIPAIYILYKDRRIARYEDPSLELAFRLKIHQVLKKIRYYG